MNNLRVTKNPQEKVCYYPYTVEENRIVCNIHFKYLKMHSTNGAEGTANEHAQELIWTLILQHIQKSTQDGSKT